MCTVHIEYTFMKKNSTCYVYCIKGIVSSDQEVDLVDLQNQV